MSQKEETGKEKLGLENVIMTAVLIFGIISMFFIIII